MSKQIIFAAALFITLAVFTCTVVRLIRFFRLTRPAYKIRNIGKRIRMTLAVAIGQTKILRRPVIGLLHALVFWGFIVILIGSIEMVIDGLVATERVLKVLGVVYDVIIAAGDIFALVVAVAIIVFLVRRLFLHVRRFTGVEMKPVSHVDANIALSLILFLMITLMGMNSFYILEQQASGEAIAGTFPVSRILAGCFTGMSESSIHFWHGFNWWAHILTIFFFANYLPYSKHFHVFMSVPNVFLSRLDPLGKLDTMENITKEVRIMMDPGQAFAASPEGEEEEEPTRFGVKDVEDVTWRNYFDSLSCTECGRCTDVCPANTTGKLLSPRKIIMDVRSRMKEKGPGMVKNGRNYDDGKSLLRNWITEEELWACTLCNACARECPINIDHPRLIVDMRRYLVMEESAAPGELNQIFSNIENNGAPWQYAREDLMLWAEGIEVPVMADLLAQGKEPEYLLWVGSAGAFDDRYKKAMRSFVRVLNHLKVDYAVLGIEESSSGDVARRAGNEMLFQMQAMMNTGILNGYGVKKILTCDPHVYNTFKNEYPDLGGNYEVIHHSRFLRELIAEGKMDLSASALKGKHISFHDPCYLGRANKEYDAPREVIDALGTKQTEMKRNKSFALCCGAGGGQMFKEAEKGDKEVFMERTEDFLETGAEIVATACPYCMVMLTDGIKYKNLEEEKKNYDIGELVALGLNLIEKG